MPAFHHADEGPPTEEQTREHERLQHDLKMAEGGPLSNPWGEGSCGGEGACASSTGIPTAEQAERMKDRREDMRARRGGLPDAPEEIPQPPNAVSDLKG